MINQPSDLIFPHSLVPVPIPSDQSQSTPKKNYGFLFKSVIANLPLESFKLDKIKGIQFSELKKQEHKLLLEIVKQNKLINVKFDEFTSFEKAEKISDKINLLTDSLINCQNKLKPFKELESKFFDVINIKKINKKFNDFKDKNSFSEEEIREIFELQELLTNAVDWLKSNGLDLEDLDKCSLQWSGIYDKARQSLDLLINKKKNEFETQRIYLHSKEIDPQEKLSGTFQLASELQSFSIYLTTLYSSDPAEKNKLFQQGNPTLKSIQDAVLILMREAQKNLKNQLFHYSASAAAEKGKGFQKGLADLIELAKSNSLLSKNKFTANAVYMQKEAVFKKSQPRAAEEEEIIAHLFNLMSIKGVLNSFTMQDTNLNRFGVEIGDSASKQRGLSLANMDSSLRKKISSLLNPKDLNLWNHYFTSSKATDSVLSEKAFYFTPDLTLPNYRTAYLKCESCKWTYSYKGVEKQSDFKTLHLLYMQDPTQLANIIPQSSLLDKPTGGMLVQALETPWTLKVSEVLTNKNYAPLKKFESKPLLKDLILFNKAVETPNVLKHIQAHLTPEAEFNSILTGEVQLLDLHELNIGFVPVLNEEYEKYEDTSFTLFQTKKSLKELLHSYMNGTVKIDTIIEFREGGVVVSKPLRDLPDLKKALEIKWELAIFDTDFSLGEDNELQILILNNKKEHLIPLRSAFFHNIWKDQSLSQSCVNRLLESGERDQRVKAWVSKEDAPLLKRLSSSGKANLHTALKPLLDLYSLSELRSNSKTEKTLQDLTNEFAKAISDITKPENLAIWKLLEKELAEVSSKQGDTLEKIAKRYKQDLSVLKALNPTINDPKVGLLAGTKVQLAYDLTSNNVEIAKKRAELAPQLFPRLTNRQQNALFERQKNRTTYLKNFQTLQSFLPTPSLQTTAQLNTYINDPSTPISSPQRQLFLEEIEGVNARFAQKRIHLDEYLATMKQIHTKIVDHCKPTYFNLMKAMYPLLADVFELNLALHKEESKIGEYFIEDTIKEVKAAFSVNSPIHQLAISLESKIQQKKDPSFFGNFD